MADFIYCLNSSTIMPTPILEKIRIAGQVGYAAIELWHSDIDAHLATGGSVADVKNAVADNGLEVPTTIFLKGWWDTVGAVYERAVDETKRRLEQAREVGATYAIGGPPLGPVDFELGVIAGTASINFIMSAMLPGPNDGKVSVESTRVDGMDDFLIVANSHHYITESEEVIRNTTSFLRDGRFVDSVAQIDVLTESSLPGG